MYLLIKLALLVWLLFPEQQVRYVPISHRSYAVTYGSVNGLGATFLQLAEFEKSLRTADTSVLETTRADD